MATPQRIDVIPGGSIPLKVFITDPSGAVVDLTGATVEATLTVGGVSEALGVSVLSATERLVLVGAALTAPHPGRQMRFRAFVTPAASVETTAIEANIHVAA